MRLPPEERTLDEAQARDDLLDACFRKRPDALAEPRFLDEGVLAPLGPRRVRAVRADREGNVNLTERNALASFARFAKPG